MIAMRKLFIYCVLNAKDYKMDELKYSGEVTYDITCEMHDRYIIKNTESWLTCANHECDHIFHLNDNDCNEETVYLLCPKCNVYTTCRNIIAEDHECYWYYTCKDCHGNNPRCDNHDVCTTNGCGFCGDSDVCGNKMPCKDCIKQYGKDSYNIDEDGQWSFKDSAQTKLFGGLNES